jgi:hypothetical protein
VTKFDIEVPEGADGGPVDVKLEKGLQIAGVVVDPAGEPVADVNVWTNVVMNGPRGGASNTSFRNAQTGEDGTFLLDSMEPGVYSLTVRASGYADRTIPDINAGTGDLRVVLEKGKSITGRVLLPDGRPAPNVWVTAQGDASGNDRTDEKGEFELPNLPDGSYTVRANTARAFGMGSGSSDEPSVMPAEQEGVTAGTQNLELRLRAGAELAGTVRDATGNPVAMANVFAREEDGGSSTAFGRTDENGRFRLTGLEPGRSFSISVSHSDFTPAAPKVVASDTTGIEFSLAPKPVEPDDTGTQQPR